MEGILQKELKNLGNMVSNISIKVEENLTPIDIVESISDYGTWSVSYTHLRAHET